MSGASNTPSRVRTTSSGMELSRQVSSSKTSMILVMGVTGSGKSHFINTLARGRGTMRESASLRSETQTCQILKTRISDDESLALVDTPGFDDTTRTDPEILETIADFLTLQHQLGIPLKGIIYLHRITDNRMQGSSLRQFKMFEKLCGKDALSNVILLTTMWANLRSEIEGLDREQELRENWWGHMKESGSYIARFDDSREMAEALVMTLVGKRPVVLEMQRELDDDDVRLRDTSAGKVLLPFVEGEDQRKKLRKRTGAATGKKLKAERKRIGWKSGIQTFAAVTGLAITVVFNVLPLFGVSVSG